MKDELECRILRRVTEILSAEKDGHDLDHTLRVLRNAERLAETELPADDISSRRIIRLAALLHDCARPEEAASGGTLCHAGLGREKSERLLREEGCRDEELIRAIRECVGRHRYRGTDAPQTLPEKILYDADKLDSLGAVGIGRAFCFAARCGARLHNTEQEALNGAAYGKEDTAWREYLVKLRFLEEKLFTGSARKLAAPRSAFMKEFFRRLSEETGSGGNIAENTSENRNA